MFKSLCDEERKSWKVEDDRGGVAMGEGLSRTTTLDHVEIADSSMFT